MLLTYYALLLRSLALRGLFVVLCPSVRERAPRVRYSDFGAFQLPKPPASEQERIVDSVVSSVGVLDGSRRVATRELELLREYRTRLVADVVTGKLDVREAAAGLSEELEGEELEAEPEVEDDSSMEAAEMPEEAVDEA